MVLSHSTSHLYPENPRDQEMGGVNDHPEPPSTISRNTWKG